MKDKRQTLRTQVLELLENNSITNKDDFFKLLSMKGPESIIKKFIKKLFISSNSDTIEKIYEYYKKMKEIDEEEEYTNTEIFYHKNFFVEKQNKLNTDFAKLKNFFFKKHPDNVYENYKYLDLNSMIQILGKYNEESLKEAFFLFCNDILKRTHIRRDDRSGVYLHNDLQMKINIMKMYDEENKIHTSIKINKLTPWFRSLLLSYLKFHHSIDLSDRYPVEEYKAVYLFDDVGIWNLIYQKENTEDIYRIYLEMPENDFKQEYLNIFAYFIIIENLQRTRTDLYIKFLSNFTCVNLPYDQPLENFYKVNVKKDIIGDDVHLEIPEISFFYLLLHYRRLKPSIWLNYLYYLKKNFRAKYNALPYFYEQFKAAEDCPGVISFYMFKEKTDYLNLDISSVKRKRSDQKQDGIQLVDIKNKRAKKQITQKQSSTKGTTSSRSSQFNKTQTQQGKMRLRSGKKVDKDQNRLINKLNNNIDEIPTLSYTN